MNKPIIANYCVYHDPCLDGFGSACIVKEALPNCKMIKGVYGKPLSCKYMDKNIILVDFSYKRDELLKIAKKAKRVVILDHHKTAKENLVDLPDNVEVIFNMNRSGVGITWDYFHPNEEMPMLFQHIQDRDLWKFKLENTKRVGLAMYNKEFDFKVWKDILDKNDLTDIIEEGRILEGKASNDIKSLINTNTREMTFLGYENILVTNCPRIYSSELGNITAKGRPFSVTYNDEKDMRTYSLRSTTGGIDVSDVAKKMGGGGMFSASGFTTSIPWVLNKY